MIRRAILWTLNASTALAAVVLLVVWGLLLWQ